MKSRKALIFNLALAGILFFVVVGIALIVIQSSSEKQLEGKKPVHQITPRLVKKGSIRLVPQGASHIFATNEQITIQAFANSQNTAIGGYDIVLEYDPKESQFVSASNLQTSFQTIIKQDTGIIRFTGVKKPNLQASIVFRDDPLVTFTFKPLSLGTHTFILDFIPGQSRASNLLSENAKQILGEVKSVTVQAGKQISLYKEKEVKLPDGKTSLTLVEVVPFNNACADCIEQAKITAKNGKDEKTLEFKSGGVAGMADVYKETFGWGIELGRTQENSVRLNVVQIQ